MSPPFPVPGFAVEDDVLNLDLDLGKKKKKKKVGARVHTCICMHLASLTHGLTTQAIGSWILGLGLLCLHLHDPLEDVRGM